MNAARATQDKVPEWRARSEGFSASSHSEDRHRRRSLRLFSKWHDGRIFFENVFVKRVIRLVRLLVEHASRGDTVAISPFWFRSASVAFGNLVI
jgi:hypothetical protein